MAITRANPVYDIAQQWVDQALKRDGSLFSSDHSVWSIGVLEEVHQRFIDQPLVGSASFLGKLQQQLDGASPSAYRLLGEALYIHLLPASNVTGDKKREIIDTVLGWSPEPIGMPDDLAQALDGGIFSVGMAYHTYRPNQLQVILEFVEAWKALEPRRREELLEEPWAFKSLLFEIPIHGAQMQREALLHLVHPETFEDIVSQRWKEEIADHYASFVSTSSTDVDRRLVDIRQALSEEHGPRFSFYDDGIIEEWNPTATKWGQFAYWAKRFLDPVKFYGLGVSVEEEEVNYKLAVAQRCAEARNLVMLGSAEWVAALKSAYTKDTNLTAWQAHTPFLQWCGSQPDEAREALLRIWDDSATPGDRVRAFSSAWPKDEVPGRGGRVSIASVLLLGEDPDEYPPYRSDPFHAALKLLDLPAVSSGADEGAEYSHFLDFLDQVRDALAERNIVLRHRLDAQSVVWSVVKNFLPAGAPDAEKEALASYRKGLPPIPDEPTSDDGPPEGTLAELEDELLLTKGSLERVHTLLASKRQVIFFGPPGTGKTYVAQELARFIAGSAGRVELVQFHPSYAYEDFVEGYRPHVVEGAPGFRLQHGPLRRLADKASADQASTYVLIIDEINRGNVAKVFGELYYLLEYRNKELSLQYSAQPFALPENLWIIGTMNTADRSIALVDSALRRRFFFVPFFPDADPVAGLLGRWLAKNKPEYVWLAGVVDRANAELGERHVAIGPSHFMRPDLDDRWIELVWNHSVMPYLEEHFFGDEHELSRFTLEALRWPDVDELDDVPTDDDADAPTP